jgi:phosphoribosylformylglycinamidine cyclo-ligase
MDYRDAGVDVEAGRAFVDRIKAMVHSTHRPEVLGGIGGFGGFFELSSHYQQPVLVSGTDGVGTKLKVAQACDRHDTVGIDLVAMCVNDVLTCGAEPLFFLDYLATGKLNPEQLAQVVSGIAAGCHQAGCALLGGETAEMPGFYGVGEYDLAGFCVGIVEKPAILDGSRVQVGDVAIALGSDGVHSNGFSLVRKIIEATNHTFADCPDGFDGQSLGQLLLTPTRLYVKPILSALSQGLAIHGMAHITGGGLPENLPRALNANQSLSVTASWTTPAIFTWLQQQGAIARSEMFSTFNMGVGFVVLVPPNAVDGAIAHFTQHQISAWAIGAVIPGQGELIMDTIG